MHAVSFESVAMSRMFVESIFDERDRELWPEFAGPSSCDSFDKLPRDRDNCAVDELADDNNCHGRRQVAVAAAFSAAVPAHKSRGPCADAAVVAVDLAMIAAAAALQLAVAVSSALYRKHRILAELLIALDSVTGRIASIN